MSRRKSGRRTRTIIVRASMDMDLQMECVEEDLSPWQVLSIEAFGGLLGMFCGDGNPKQYRLITDNYVLCIYSVPI